MQHQLGHPIGIGRKLDDRRIFQQGVAATNLAGLPAVAAGERQVKAEAPVAAARARRPTSDAMRWRRDRNLDRDLVVFEPGR